MSLADGGSSPDPVDVRSAGALHEALHAGRIPSAVYGLGKVGLPMAAVLAERTGRVIGVDIDPNRVEAVNEAATPFEHEPGLGALLESVVSEQSLVATTDARQAATTARVHRVIVPVTTNLEDESSLAPPWTPEGANGDDQTADLTALTETVDAIGSGLTPGDLVIIESTVPPFTTSELVVPLLERSSGLDRGAFGVVFSPERVASGQAIADIRGAYPKIVGGTDSRSQQAAVWYFEAVTDAEVIPVTDAATAEAVKLFEGVYRDVNIALANELAMVADQVGLDGREAIEAANTQPYCDLHDPGAGVGGHCIPIYPYLLREVTARSTPLISTARRVNDGMPSYVVSLIEDGLGAAGTPLEESTVGVLGVTYRPGIPETARSPARGILRGLQSLGVHLFAFDPAIDSDTVFGIPCRPIDDLDTLDLDAVVITTAHEAFTSYDWSLYDGIIIDCPDALEQPTDRTQTVGRGSR